MRQVAKTHSEMRRQSRTLYPYSANGRMPLFGYAPNGARCGVRCKAGAKKAKGKAPNAPVALRYGEEPVAYSGEENITYP